ncbi:hypothetical protein CPter91_4522 [Collimonas pratensis]|uniref:Uncharacterized protein n=1 Tax=Collimonas pratensis TaxID=279113 RepID=A0A127Q9U1_9BURK|nr:hypothetical protein CPter91_4522 [Collimonas pratensis]
MEQSWDVRFKCSRNCPALFVKTERLYLLLRAMHGDNLSA